MQTNFCQEIFHGMHVVKRHLVDELKAERARLCLSPEAVDRMIGMGPEWPTVREVEMDPILFTYALYQSLAWTALESDEAVSVSGIFLKDEIDLYLTLPGKVDQAVAAFQATYRLVNVTNWGPNPADRAEKILNGEKVPLGGINSISPLDYARDYMFLSIFEEIRTADSSCAADS